MRVCYCVFVFVRVCVCVGVCMRSIIALSLPSTPPPPPRLETYKWRAVVTEIARIHKEGRPVLVGTTSVEKSELLSDMLTEEGIKHRVRGGGVVFGAQASSTAPSDKATQRKPSAPNPSALPALSAKPENAERPFPNARPSPRHSTLNPRP